MSLPNQYKFEEVDQSGPAGMLEWGNFLLYVYMIWAGA